MSSELHKYIEKAITKKEVLLNGEVIKFPQDKNSNKQLNLELNKLHIFFRNIIPCFF